MFACKKCSELFPSKNTRRSHTRAVHQQYCNVTQADGTRCRVRRSDSDGWVCPHPSCLSSFARSDLLQTHYNQIHTVTTHERGQIHMERPREDGCPPTPSTVPQDSSAEEGCPSIPLAMAQDTAQEDWTCPSTPIAMGNDATEELTPELLRCASLCIVKYNSMTLLYCRSCDGMVDGSKAKSVCNHIQTHFKVRTGEQRHGGTPRQQRCRSWNRRRRSWSNSIQLNDLEAAVGAIPFTPLEDLVSWLFRDYSSSIVPRIPLLSVRDGFHCSLCSYYGVNTKVMKKHKREKHNTENDSECNVTTPCKVQTLLPGYGIRYFGVDCPVEVATTDCNDVRWNAFMDKITAIKETVRSSRDPPPRQLSPWLRKSKWSHYAAQLIPEDASFSSIKGAMEMSNNSVDPYLRVTDVLNGYANLLQNQVLQQAEFRVRKVVAMDTVKGFTEFMAASTIKQYIPVIRGFVLSLLRSACDAPRLNDFIHMVVAPDYMKADLQALHRQLLALPEGALQRGFDYRIIHRVLLGLWTPKHESKMLVKRSKDCLFVQFMILYSIRPCDGGSRPSYSWMSVKEITKMLSMLKFWCRATIEMEICKELWNPAASGMDIVDVERLVGYTDESLVLRETPFSYISMMQKLACSIVGDTTAKPQLMSSHPSSCNIGGYDISIGQIRSMLKALIHDCNTIMRQEVLLGLNTHWIQQLLERRTPILDAVNNGAHGYSFITDPKNPFHRHKNDLFRHMFDRGASHYVGSYDAQGKIDHFDVKALGSWMTACRRLEDLFGMLLHLTSSQPPRGNEYESFLVRNTSTGNRAFFWSEETLVMFQDYSKTDSGPKPKSKLIVRFLPHCLRRLFLEYLSLVRPVQVVVAAVLWGGEAAGLYQDLWFVQHGSMGVSATITQVMRREFVKHCGAPIGLSDYRHLAAFFSGSIHSEVLALQAEPFADSAGHSRQTEGRCYGQNMCDHRTIGRHRWRAFKFVALKWQWYLHLPSHDFTSVDQTTPPHMAGSPAYNMHANVDPASTTDFAASLATPSPTTPRAENEFPLCAPKRRRLFRDCDGQYKAKDLLELIDPYAMHWAEAALKCSGYDAWKIPQQGVATAMALDNRRDFIAILPTGSGKSFVYMAPAQVSGKTVVVIVPLLMLIIDHLAECEARGIGCAEFRVNKIDPTHPPRLVFVPVEIAITDGFQIWAKQVISAGGLHSIFIDEVHLVLATYRTRMTQLLGLLSCLNCQVIGLTASLAPDQEIQVNSMLGRDFVVVRSKTTRPNLEYNVKDVDDVDAEITDRLRSWLASDRAPEDRALVYCMTRREVEALHTYLEERNVPNTFLHASLQTKQDKVERLQSWELGTTTVMVTTSVLGCGYNYQAVRLVLHKGSCFTLAGFHQESGRGGRDGKRTICQVISNPTYRRSMESRISNGQIERANEVLSSLKQTNEWIEDGDVCRRFNLHCVLDGEADVCLFLHGAVKCDVCSTKSDTFAPRRGHSNNGSTHGCDMSLLEDLAPPEACVIRPTCMRRERYKLQDLEALHLVRRLGGDGNDCLLCNESHKIHRCPKMRGRCLRCFQAGHTATDCPIKQSMQGHVANQCCRRCYFQLDAIGDKPIHKWSVDGDGICKDLSGERIRILIWSVYRSEEGIMNTALKRLFPGMPHDDVSLEPWLLGKEPDHMLNSFVRVAAAIMGMDR